MAAIDLETGTIPRQRDPFAIPEEGMGITDYARGLAAGGYGVVGTAAGATQYLTGAEEDSIPASVRRWSESGAASQIQKMSPGAQRAVHATVLPGEGPDIWDQDVSLPGALAMKTTMAIPSIAASLIPGALAARVALGLGAARGAAGAIATGVGGTAAGAQSAGDVFNQIQDTILKEPDAKLQEENDIYRGFRAMGMTEDEAKRRITERAEGLKPLYMAAITAITSHGGIEGALGAHIAGKTVPGLGRRVLRGAGGEAPQEFTESGAGEAFGQAGAHEARIGDPQYQWAKILEAAVQGGTVGALTGGALATVQGGGRRRTRDEILNGKPKPEDQKQPEPQLPVDVAETPVSEAQSTPSVLAEVRAKETASGQAIAAEQTNPVKAGEEMPAAIAQKPPEQHGGVDLKPGEPAPALTPTTVTVDPEHAVALAAPASVPQTITPSASRRQNELLAQAEKELLGGAPEAIPPIPAHSVTSPEIAAAITHAPSIVKGMIDAKVSEAATQSAPARPDPAAALSAAAVPAATGATEPTTPAPVAPAVGLAGASATSTQTLAETPVTSIPSEVIEPPVAPAPVKRKPGRPRKNESHPAVAGQSSPLTADEKAARDKLVTDHSVASLVEVIRTREDALRGIEDVEVAKPIVDKAKAAIDVVVTEAAKVIGKRKASTLAYDARQIVNAERAAAARAAPRPEATGNVLESQVETKEVADPRPIKEIITEIRAENPDMTAAAATKRALAAKREKIVARTPEVIKKERKGKRVSAAAKEQIAAGEEEILSAEERDKRKTARENAEAAARLRRAMEDNPYDPNDLGTIKPQRAYIKRLLDAVGKTNSLANLPAESDQYLKHLAAAKKAVRDFSDDAEEKMIDFMSADHMLRQGQDPYTTAPTVTGASFDEQAAAQTDIEAAGGTNLVARQAETSAYRLKRRIELGRETKKIRREKAEILAHRAKLREEGPAEPEPEVKVEKKGRVAAAEKPKLTPAEIKARAAAIREGLQVKRAEAVERAEASPRTEEQAVRQIETIRLGENTDEVQGGEVLRLETRAPEGKLVTVPTVSGGTMVLSQRPVALRDVMTDMDTDFAAGNMARELAKVFDKYVGDTPVVWVSRQEMLRIAGVESDGAYLNKRKIILLNEDIQRWPMRQSHTVLHEAAHAALFDVMENNAAVAITVTKLARWTRDHLKMVGYPVRGMADTYGLQFDEHDNPNVHEFMSEALANREFQQLLAGISAPQELKDEVGIDKPGASLWDGFVGAVRRWFGWNRNDINILDLALRHAENALTGDKSSLLTRAPSGTEMSLLKTADFKDGMDDRLAATSLNVSRWGKMVQTVDQIVRGARSLFEGRAPDDLHDALAMMDKQATDGSIASVRLAAKWIEWSRKNEKAARPAANLAMLAVRNDIDPRKPKDQHKSLTGDKFREYQRVARYDEIKAKWDALPSDARALLDEMFDHYTTIAKKLASARAKSLIDVWLEGTSTSLTDMQRDALTQRVLNGTLTEKGSDKLQPGQQSDEELIGDENAFRDLQGVELRLPTIYMPHMRHGNIVVRTKEKLPDLMGGKLLEESDKHAVVEFSGPNARDLYEAWAKSEAMVDGPDITSANLKRYLIPSGELVSEINSRGYDHEVRIEARVQLQGLYAFDKGRDAAAFIKQAKATGAFAEVDEKILQRADSYDEGDLPPSQLSGILRGIQKRKGLDENTKNLLKATVESAAIRMMPGHRIQQRMLKREGVRGGSEDLSRSLISYGTTASEALARLENMPAVRKALETMRSQIGKVGSADAQQQSLVVGELTKRVYDNVVHPQDTARWMQDLLRLSQLDKLASPAYTVVNGMQPWMVTLPVLGSEHGNMRAAAEMSRAYKDVGFGSVFRGAFGNMKKATRNFTSFGIDINNPIESVLRKVSSKDDGKRLNEGLRKAISLGMIQETAGIETGSGGPPGGKLRTVADGVDRIARQLPIAIEAINRAVTFIAAYRLAYAQSSNHDMAVQYGIDMINRTQFNYAAWNKPGFFNKPWLRPALQFKAYAQGMTALLADATHKTFKGASKKEKQQAFKLLMNIVGVQVAMAGAMGLPGIELIKAGFMIAAMLGLGGGWDDAERWLRQISDDAFGKKTSELIHKGVLSRAIGVDLSSRLGLSDMWLFGEPKMYDRQGTLAYFGQLLMGAPGGLILDWSEGLKAAGTGDFAKSFELMMPVKFIADTASAARGRFDPNSKSPLSTSDAVLKSIGFRSGAAVERSFETGKKIQVTKDMNAKARELERDYLQATTAGERVKIKARILTHNREMNEKKLGLKQKALSPKTLDGIRERRKAERSQITGD